VTIAFYIAAIIAVIATARVITHTNAVHALLYLVLSLLGVAVAFYTLGAPFAAALEVIVYAGAIMVLFVFVVMMLNLNIETINLERRWIQSVDWIAPIVMGIVLLGIMVVALWASGAESTSSYALVTPREVGREMFGPYLLAVELGSFLLLAALIVAGHVGREDIRQHHYTEARKENAQDRN